MAEIYKQGRLTDICINASFIYLWNVKVCFCCCCRCCCSRVVHLFHIRIFFIVKVNISGSLIRGLCDGTEKGIKNEFVTHGENLYKSRIRTTLDLWYKIQFFVSFLFFRFGCYWPISQFRKFKWKLKTFFFFYIIEKQFRIYQYDFCVSIVLQRNLFNHRRLIACLIRQRNKIEEKKKKVRRKPRLDILWKRKKRKKKKREENNWFLE